VLLGEHPCERGPRQVPGLDQDDAEQATGALLLGERTLEPRLGEEAPLHEQRAELPPGEEGGIHGRVYRQRGPCS
jgi:hypothetical protein